VIFPGLAAAVVERIAPYAPERVEILEEPAGFLQARAGETRHEAFALDEPEVDLDVDPLVFDPPYPAFAVLEALDFLQEFVRNDLGIDWDSGEPWAVVEDEEIHFGYAGGTSFEPIPFSALSPDRL
jgi:hypothetical protein